MSNHLTNQNKRKRQNSNTAILIQTYPNNYSEPSPKRHKTDPLQTSTHSTTSSQSTNSSVSPFDSLTTTKSTILSNTNLYFYASPKEDALSTTNNNHNNSEYTTPIICKKLFTNTPNTPHINSTLSLTPYTPYTLTDTHRTSPNLFTLSENAFSIVYKYLSFNDILQLCKCNTDLHNQSYKLLSSLTLVCKSIHGISEAQVIHLLSQCSYYLKQIDLTYIAFYVTDTILHTLSAHCTQLTNVILHGCESISDKGLISFLSQCKYIHTLDISGCHGITSAIGPTLSELRNLRSLNVSWCTDLNCDIIPYLVHLNLNYSLTYVNLHCCNRFVTVFPAFKHVFESIRNMKRVKNELCIVGGLQQKYMNDSVFAAHIRYLKQFGVEYTEAESMHLRSISEYDFGIKLKALMKVEKIAKYGKREGYRLYTVKGTDKIYCVIETELGVFGTKLLPDLDFKGERDTFMKLLKMSNRSPIEFLKSECGLGEWDWREVFQSKRTLSLLGMGKSANWLQGTSMKDCRNVNTFINTEEMEANKENIRID